MIDLKKSKKLLPKVKKIKKISLKKATILTVFVALFSFELGSFFGLSMVIASENRSKALSDKKESEYASAFFLIKSAKAKSDNPLFGTKSPGSPPRGYISKVQKVPIIYYHHVSNKTKFPNYMELGMNVPEALLDQQVKYLADNGFNTITLDDLYQSFYKGKPLPPKPVILTFDDGYRDNYEHAFPILKKYKKMGTFFVISGFVGNKNYMTREQLKEMSDSGMEIEPHAKSHPDLTKADVMKITVEIALSKAEIEKITGKPANFMAYPFGKYNEKVINVLKSQGYLLAATIRGGKDQDNSKPYELKRYPVGPKTNIRAFAGLVSP